MRRIRIAEHMSLDGFIAPDDSQAQGNWTAPYRTGFDLLLGRRTYDEWAGFWPKVQGGPFADGLNAATKYVATHRPESLSWGPVGSLGADVVEGIRRLREQEGPDLVVCGSATLAAMLFERGLVDELVLTVFPLLLGTGKRCFPHHASPREFALVSSQATPTGVLLNIYRPAP